MVTPTAPATDAQHEAPPQGRSLLAIPMVFGASCLALAATFDGETGPTLCVFRQCTGGYCPGCGGSRAVVALAKGDVAGSWAIHPWVPLIAVQLAAVLVMLLAGARDRVRQLVVPLLVLNLVLGLSIWAIRLSTGAIPAPW